MAKKKYEVTARLRAAGNWFVATLARRGFGARSTYLLTVTAATVRLHPPGQIKPSPPGPPRAPGGKSGGHSHWRARLWWIPVLP